VFVLMARCGDGLEMYWKRFQLRFPIFFSAKNAERVLHVYTKYAEDGWTTKECRELEWNAIRVVDPEVLCSWVTQSDVPLVALTTPGTLARGLSLQIFQWIAPEEKNLLIIPHFCLSGTMEQRMLEKKKGEESIPIRCKVRKINKKECIERYAKVVWRDDEFAFWVSLGYERLVIILFLLEAKLCRVGSWGRTKDGLSCTSDQRRTRNTRLLGTSRRTMAHM